MQGADTGGREASAVVGEADQKHRSDHIVSKRHRVLPGNRQDPVFETEGSQVLAHTETEIFEARKKLYELEDMLGSDFLRISKSAIVNLNRIYAIRRNLAASSEISFQGTHKQIYVSRAYIKVLKERLEEKRLER